MGDADDEIQKALAQLEESVARRVRLEQLRDQLTGLSNGEALREAIRGSLAGGTYFWVAFIEVDRFKSINDRFGYENADALLVKIASQLESACSWFRGLTQAFRAHGDEFYMMGILDGASAPPTDEEIGNALDLARQAVGSVKVIVENQSDPMSCTVSVGWLSTRGLESVQTDRSIIGNLERAVAEAKRTRDCVERYRPQLARDDAITLRADCGKCRCKFSMDLKRTENRRSEKLSCPNCSTPIERPPEPSGGSGPAPPSV